MAPCRVCLEVCRACVGFEPLLNKQGQHLPCGMLLNCKWSACVTCQTSFYSVMMFYEDRSLARHVFALDLGFQATCHNQAICPNICKL